MATLYDVLSGLTTTQLIGTTQTQDVELYTLQAKPSGVVFYVRIPADFLDSGLLDSLASNEAELYNAIAAIPHVQAVSMYEDITAANQINDRLVLTIASSSGRSTVTRDDQSFNLDPGYMAGVVAGIVGELDAIEAL